MGVRPCQARDEFLGLEMGVWGILGLEKGVWDI